MLQTITALTPVSILEQFEKYLLSDFKRAKHFLINVNPDLLEEISRKKAVATFRHATIHTPAYQHFLNHHKINPRSIITIDDFNRFVPHTDKENYIKKFSYEDRCQEGHLPRRGNVDESGGTSGIATNWIHDFSEENALLKAVDFEFNYIFDGKNKNYFVISAWSSGPWATGVKFCELMEHVALVKNTSTDAKDIINTLKMFGPKRNYLIGAYPPFIKNLLEENKDSIPWKKYNIDLVTGGEGVTLDWVHYVRNLIKPGAKIISSYGASDVDIGVGFETPLAFYIRELFSKNEAMRHAIFGRDDIPMIFQYNPTVHYIQEIVGAEGKHEFVITLLDRHAALAKIKYNLHDEGRKFTYDELMKILNIYEKGSTERFLKNNQGEILHLPFLCIFGRSDGTLSFDGANVFPHQIERGIMRNKELSGKTNRFKIEKKYDKKHNVEFHVHVELKKTHKPHEKLKQKYHKVILDELLDSNPDYKESYTYNKTLTPKINLYNFDHPLFAQDQGKAKNIYIVKN